MLRRLARLSGWLAGPALVSWLSAAHALEPAAQSPSPHPPSPASNAGGFSELARRGLVHFESERFAEALAAFEAALRHPAEPAERATLELNAATCEFALGRNVEAEHRFLRAARLDREHASGALVNAAFAALFAGRLGPAATYLQRSAALLPPGGTERAELATRRAELARRLSAARRERTAPRPASGKRREPLPRAGVSAFALASAGYDDNAAQSGASDLLDQGDAARVGSAFASAQVELGYVLRPSTALAVRPYYAGDWLGLFESSVQPLSLLGHEAGAKADVLVGSRAVLRLTSGFGVAFTGLDQPEPLLSELVLGARLDWTHGSVARTRLELALRPTFGLGPNDHLDGLRADLGVAERLRFGAFELTPRLAVRSVSAGTESLVLDAAAFAVCEPSCADYRVPGSYLAASAGLDAAYELASWLIVGASFRGEPRFYLEPHGISGYPETDEKRRDLRLRFRGGVELPLDASGTLRVTLDHTYLTNRSNLAASSTDPEHVTDYADRNFRQNTTELGVLLVF